MGLNIKNNRVERLAREVASFSGETTTSGIMVALEERLARLKKQAGAPERKRRIKEILDSLPPPPPGVTGDHSDFYDEWGLPK